MERERERERERESHFALICSTEVVFERSDLTQPKNFQLEVFRNDSEAQSQVRQMSGIGQSVPGTLASSYVSVGPHEAFHSGDGGSATISLELRDSPGNVVIYSACPSNNYRYRALDTSVVNGRAVASISEGGFFVASSPLTTILAVVGSIVVVLAIISIVVIGVIIYFAVRRDKWRSTKSKVSSGMKSISRSFAKKV